MYESNMRLSNFMFCVLPMVIGVFSSMASWRPRLHSTVYSLRQMQRSQGSTFLLTICWGVLPTVFLLFINFLLWNLLDSSSTATSVIFSLHIALFVFLPIILLVTATAFILFKTKGNDNVLLRCVSETACCAYRSFVASHWCTSGYTYWTALRTYGQSLSKQSNDASIIRSRRMYHCKRNSLSKY